MTQLSIVGTFDRLRVRLLAEISFGVVFNTELGSNVLMLMFASEEKEIVDSPRNRKVITRLNGTISVPLRIMTSALKKDPNSGKNDRKNHQKKSEE